MEAETRQQLSPYDVLPCTDWEETVVYTVYRVDIPTDVTMEKGMPPSSPPPPGFSPGPAYGGPPPPPPLYTETQPNVVYVSGLQFGSESQRLTCPHCQSNITTSIETEANSKTHLFALLICVLGGWCCAPCPYCMDSCLVKKHYCPACKAYLGESSN